MITVQDIHDVKFSKTLGGYKTTEVDAFLDECAATVEELTAANDENNRKLQVLAETVLEYRNQEDSIRTALLSAQRMSETTINEAKEKANAIIEQAQKDADAALENANKEIACELQELQRIKEEVSAFKTRLLSAYREHLTLIGVLGGDNADEAEPKDTPAAEETAEECVEQPQETTHKLDLSAFELEEE